MNRISQKKPIALIITGVALLLGPLWGMMGTVLGMIQAFTRINQGGPDNSEALAADMGTALWATAIGIMVVPIGLIFLCIGIVWLLRINRTARASNQPMQPTGDTRAGDLEEDKP